MELCSGQVVQRDELLGVLVAADRALELSVGVVFAARCELAAVPLNLLPECIAPRVLK